MSSRRPSTTLDVLLPVEFVTVPRQSEQRETPLSATNSRGALPPAPVGGIATKAINACTARVSHQVKAVPARVCNTRTARTTAFVIATSAALSIVEGDLLRYLALTLAAAFVLLLTTNAHAAQQGTARPALIARISRQVFGPRWKVAACIAHYESTDGAHLVNGPNLGPWQINAKAHPWVDANRLVHDWWYSARVAFRLSTGGRNWFAWTTRRFCV